MYKLMLCLRYLKTRWIALASIISVTLGVATMVVVNAVMSGFSHEMHVRLHGILSDVVMESHSLDGFYQWERHMQAVREVAGDDIENMTVTVHVPAMLNMRVRDQWLPRQLTVIGIDDETYNKVSDFSKYLKHPSNRQQVDFNLKETGYDGPENSPLVESGWEYRREKIAYQKELEAEMRRFETMHQHGHMPRRDPNEIAAMDSPLAEDAAQPAPLVTPKFADDPDAPPLPGAPPADLAERMAKQTKPIDPNQGGDPFALRHDQPKSQTFDPMKHQAPGIILGMAVASIRQRDAEGQVKDYFLAVPGDDVRLTFPSAESPPKAINATFTVVDFYESKMNEYDAGFAFVPLSKLQSLRYMTHPELGSAVSTIQIRLKPGVDLNQFTNKLRAAFPAETHPFRIQSWKDMQGPLLAAVQMEKTILNILLFLIIGVAGFGILATFYMIVVEKTKDIGILKSLGASGGGIMSIFVGYGLSLGIVGSGVGCILGLLFVWNINHIAKLIEMITGREVFDPTIYYFQEIPTIVEPAAIAMVVFGAMLIAVLASVLPAIRAARLHPVEALRYE
ncbi:Lipoprotein-releasing system transmembrane protein LolE [Bremerella volcania]|uniref:Lipoprotein-releasing system transmembrane protein LolE n=1 Tax=Bremerella volcania TaxID=2527984 RepID=A0A518C252_9BACT|nr:FtsX-like permease family protein [Bremerella volcania]QDU73300.1 Lipoprotein-releasing system transmembrane protein LolE [Bremerella volcania]